MKLVGVKIALVACISVLFGLQAVAFSQPPPIPKTMFPESVAGYVYLKQSIGNNYAGYDTLYLNHYFNLSSYEGYEVVAVEVRMRTFNGKGVMYLSADGAPLSSSKTIYPSTGTYQFKPWYPAVIGQHVVLLMLEMQGEFFVYDVQLILAPPTK